MRLVRLVAFVRIVLAAVVALACAGCGHPLGTNDLILAYRTVGTPPPDLEALATARLRAAEITADVATTHEGVQVTVDRESSGSVDRLLAWPGGLAAYEVIPNATEEGAHERALTANARTIIVRDPAAVDLHDAVASVVVSADGRSIEVHLTTDGDARIAKASTSLSSAQIAIAFDREALFVGPLARGPWAFSFGDDLEAYARARATRFVLASPPLPSLTRFSAVAAPPNFVLAGAALGLPFVLSIAWLFFVRRFDRAQPEPWWLVLATFALGGVSLIPAALAEVGWSRASPWLDPSLATLGGRLAALPLALPVFVLVIGVSEEGSKFLGAWSLAFHRREFDEPIDGIVYGAASSLGFAAIENVKYFALGRLGAGLVATRMFITLPAHIFFGAIWGYALGRKLVRPRTSLLGFLALAAIAHGVFDACLSIDGLTPLAFTLNLGLAAAFVVALRHALRHGIVTADSANVARQRRVLHAVGSPVGFFVSVVALHLVAAILFVASTYAQGAHWRVGPLFFSAMSSLVTMLALAAYFLSVTMPLDAVIDDYGVTFAGAARAWGTIRGVDPSPRGLHVRTTAGDVWIGPASREAIAKIAREIQARLTSGA